MDLLNAAKLCTVVCTIHITCSRVGVNTIISKSENERLVVILVNIFREQEEKVSLLFFIIIRLTIYLMQICTYRMYLADTIYIIKAQRQISA